MSAETLRRAAAQMRERAEAARQGTWYSEGADVLAAWSQPRPITTCDGSPVPEGNIKNAEHIASWHPAVALAVADWLEAAATRADGDATVSAGFVGSWADPALAVARAYLGEAS